VDPNKEHLEKPNVFRVPLNDLSRLTSGEISNIHNLLLEVLKSGSYILGKQVKKFETEIASFIGVNFAFGVGNGTDALEIAMRSLGIKSGDEVVMTANSGGYSRIAAERIGATSKYVDVDMDLGLISAESLDAYLRNNTKPKAVVVTHLYGNAADVPAIVEICNPYGVQVIEDCAQSFGAQSGSLMCGGIGAVSTFSFFPTKNLGGIGDGGAVLTSNNEIAKRINALRQYGWASKYNVEILAGVNSRLDELQAAILSMRMSQVLTNNQIRRNILERYRIALADTKVTCLWSNDQGSVGHLAVVACSERDKLINHLNDRQIDTSIHYPILDVDQVAWRGEVTLIDDIPNTRQLNNQIVTLPCFPSMTNEEIIRVSNALAEFESS